MPVLDHDVHPSTKVGNEYRWGCWNLPRPVLGQKVKSQFSGEEWEYVFSTECRNDISLTDPFCRGCKWAGTGEIYAKKIQEQGR